MIDVWDQARRMSPAARWPWTHSINRQCVVGMGVCQQGTGMCVCFSGYVGNVCHSCGTFKCAMLAKLIHPCHGYVIVCLLGIQPRTTCEGGTTDLPGSMSSCDDQVRPAGVHCCGVCTSLSNPHGSGYSQMRYPSESLRTLLPSCQGKLTTHPPPPIACLPLTMPP